MALPSPSAAASSAIDPTVASSAAPSVGQVPRGYYPDGNLTEWQERQPTLSLPEGGGRRSGHLWVATSSSGLQIAGQAAGEPPRFAATAETLHSSDHLVVQLRLAPELDLPPIGWGNQFGYGEVPTEDDCEGHYPPEVQDRAQNVEYCRAWHAGQTAHRQRLERLFTRRWVIARGSGTESWRGLVIEEEASLAFAGMDLDSRELFNVLAPRGRPYLRALPMNGYGFEITIPWEALPPTPSLAIDRIQLAVEAHRGHSATSETASSLTVPTEIVLAQSRRYRVGPCGVPLEGLDLFNNVLPAYYLPGKDLEIQETLVLANEAGGYRYQPQGRSPGLYRTTHFGAESAAGDIVCGPLLRVFRNRQSVAVRHASKNRPVFVDQPLTTRREGDDLFVTVGPRIFGSRFGSGECGACPRVEALVYHLPDGDRAKPVFEYYSIIRPSQLMDADVHVSDDWATIEVFERRRTSVDEPARWYSQTWCRKGPAYRVCAEESESPGPASRVLPMGSEWAG